MTQTQENVQQILKQSAGLNLPVIRTWLFNSGRTDIYFQNCTNGALEINDDDETGLGRIDYVIQQAEKNNVKLIFALTNNWPDFGLDNRFFCFFLYNIFSSVYSLNYYL